MIPRPVVAPVKPVVSGVRDTLDSLSKISDSPNWRFPPLETNGAGQVEMPKWVADLFPTREDAANPGLFIDKQGVKNGYEADSSKESLDLFATVDTDYSVQKLLLAIENS